MRLDPTVLVLGASFLSCNKSLVRASAFPATDAKKLDPDLTHDTNDVVPAKSELRSYEMKREEEREMFMKIVKELAESVATYFHPSSVEGGTKSVLELEREVLLMPHLYRPYATELEPLLQHWYDVEKKSIDELAQLLGLTTTKSLNLCFLRASDAKKIEVLRFYIDHVNQKENTQHTLIKTLTKYYGDRALSAVLMESIRHRSAFESIVAIGLQREMIAGWMDRKLPAEELFDMLKLKDKGKEALYSTELLTLERYVEAQLHGKPLPSLYTDLETVLPQHRLVTLEDGTQLPLHQFEQRRDRVVVGILSKGFGDGEFAIMLGKALARYPFDVKSRTYMDAVLWHWKDEGKTDLEHVFNAEFFEKHSLHGQDTARAIMDRYRAYEVHG
uniref:RxLR effector candidate protein n=1 Tax=Peronospora matthiolae TaxID=2874970 RepID=A0AAV1TVH8_9STRA